MLDVHILVMDYTPKVWVEQCRASLEVAVAQAGFPVFLHFLPGIYGHLGQARRAGYSRGTAEYVTHVDDDDYVLPGAFVSLLPHMQARATAITTGETIELEDGSTRAMPDRQHHLAVFRRDYIDTLTLDAFKHFPDQYALNECQPVHIRETNYVHRIRAGSGSRRARSADVVTANAERKALRPDLTEIEHMTAAQIAVLNDRQLRGTQ